MEKLKIAFICIHNSCRSQMAEAIFKDLTEDKFEVYSAGMEDYHEIKPLAIEVIEELGINISNQYPKLINEIPNVDIVITMGCGVSCPIIPSILAEDWDLEDPSGKDIVEFRKTRDEIIKLSKLLLKKINKL